MKAWKLCARGPGWEVRADDGTLVGRLSEIARRDAALMCAAPELLDVCEESIRQLRSIAGLSEQVTTTVRLALPELKTAVQRASGASMSERYCSDCDVRQDLVDALEALLDTIGDKEFAEHDDIGAPGHAPDSCAICQARDALKHSKGNDDANSD